MQTTVQVDKSTLQKLEKLKEKYNAKSYNEVINAMAEKEIKLPKSLFGAHPEMKSFKRDNGDFHEF